MLNLKQLLDLNKTELGKLSKSEIIETITSRAFEYTSRVSESDRLRTEKANNQLNERAACVMLASFLDIDIEKEEYSGKLLSEKLNILELSGRVCAYVRGGQV